MSQEFLDEILSALPAVARTGVSMFAPKIAENETFAAVGAMIQQLAGDEGLSVQQFFTSGRAVQVLRALAAGQPPEKGEIVMFKCPECNHIGYEVTQ